MIMSVDGKISTGNTDDLDIDVDFPKIVGVREGLKQYYDLEKETALHFLITGAVMTKKCPSLDVNNRSDIPIKVPANCIIIDNTHLEKSGIKYLLKKFNSLIVVSSNPKHPSLAVDSVNLETLFYENEINFKDLFKRLKSEFKIDALTIQSGSTINSVLLRGKLIDRISFVVAPALIGGKDTPSLIGGKSLTTSSELKHVKALKLVDVKKLEHSYVHLTYDVINETKIV